MSEQVKTIVDPYTQKPFELERVSRSLVQTDSDEFLVPLIASNSEMGGSVDISWWPSGADPNIETTGDTMTERLNNANGTKNTYYPWEWCAKFKLKDKDKWHKIIAECPEVEGYAYREFLVKYSPPPIIGPKSKLYAGYDILFTRPDSVNGLRDTQRDPVLPELILARYFDEALFNGTHQKTRIADLTYPNSTWNVFPNESWDSVNGEYNLPYSGRITLTDWEVFTEDYGLRDLLHVKKLFVTFKGDHIAADIYANDTLIGHVQSMDPGNNLNTYTFEYLFPVPSDVKLEKLEFRETDDSGCYITNISVEQYGERWWEDWAYNSPYDTEWAFEGMMYNPTGAEFNIQNANNLYFVPFSNALDGYVGDNIEGPNAICHILSTDTYIDFNFSHWQKGGGGGFVYTRADTTLPPEEVTFARRDVPEGWVYFKKPSNVDGSLPEYQDIVIPDVLTIARGDDYDIYNAEVEGAFDTDLWDSPKDTLWAFGDKNGNPPQDDPLFTIENANNLSFAVLNDYGMYYNVGNTAIVRVPSLNQYFYLKFTHYGLENADYEANAHIWGDFEYIRTLPIAGPIPYVNPSSLIFNGYAANGDQWYGMIDASATTFAIIGHDFYVNLQVFVFDKSTYTRSGYASGLGAGRSIYTDWGNGSLDIGYGSSTLFIERDNNTINAYGVPTYNFTPYGTVAIPRNFYGAIAAHGSNAFVIGTDKRVYKLDTGGNTVSTSAAAITHDPQKFMIAQSGAMFAAGQKSGVGLSVTKINPAMTMAWNLDIPGPNWGGRDLPMAYNELTGNSGVLYLSDYYNERINVVNTGTGTLIRQDTYAALGIGTGMINAIAADASGYYLLIDNDQTAFVKFISADGLTISTVAEIREPDPMYMSRYKWILLNGNDILLATTGDNENNVNPKLIRVPKP